MIIQCIQENHPTEVGIVLIKTLAVIACEPLCVKNNLILLTKLRYYINFAAS